MWGLGRRRPLSPPVAAIMPRHEQARLLAENGRYREAVDLLDGLSSEDLDARTLCDLVRWRNAAFDPQAGRPQWPRRFADPFPGAAGPPEIHVRDLDSDVLGGAIQHHGCLLVREMIDPDQTGTLTGIVGQAFAAARASRAGASDRPGSAWYSPYPLTPDDGMTEDGRSFGLGNGGIWTGDSPRALNDFINFLKAHGVVRTIEDYLGERAFLSLGKCTMRVVPPPIRTSWHQDGAFLGPDIRTVNVWLALSDCGEDAPGLDIYPKRLRELAETGSRDAITFWTVGDAVVEELAATTPVVTPVFKAGDALLFDQLFLHRTSVRPGMTRDRLAIESWFFAGSTFPMKQMPFAI